MSDVRVRIAPSPTGDPHVGTAYVALFNYAFARVKGGKFVLRIEDTDQTRSTPESEAAILRSLAWLGLDWDEGPDKGGPFGPYRQSERSDIYREHAERLIASGGAYRCFCTTERLNEVRAAQRAAKQNMRYDGHCKGLSADEVQARVDAGEPHVVRLDMPQEGVTVIPDRLRGEIPYNNDQMDDQVLMKSDGFPTYHLANVVDDHLMGISHVIRAEEWIPSTPKHLRLYELFGWEPPVFVHLPLLRNQDRSKISKRKNPTSLDYYERAGFLPEAMLNFLGLMGYSMPDAREQFSLSEMVESFDWDRVSLGGPVFDVKKLEWLNGLTIRALTPTELLDRVIARVFDRDYMARFIEYIQPRIERLDQFVDTAQFFFNGSLDYAPEALLDKKVVKHHDAKEVRDALLSLVEKLDALRAWDLETVEGALRVHAEGLGWKAGHLFMPARIAVTGRKASPPLFETMVALGKPICQARLREAVERMAPLAKEAVQARQKARQSQG
jgi:glutamyl-tRNA synthetase